VGLPEDYFNAMIKKLIAHCSPLAILVKLPDKRLRVIKKGKRSCLQHMKFSKSENGFPGQ
jgi:hypothetical protein